MTKHVSYMLTYYVLLSHRIIGLEYLQQCIKGYQTGLLVRFRNSNGTNISTVMSVILGGLPHVNDLKHIGADCQGRR